MQFITKQNTAIQCIIFKFGSTFSAASSVPFSSPDKMLFDAFDCVDAKFEKRCKMVIFSKFAFYCRGWATKKETQKVSLVRIKGLEPPRRKASDPKSDVATNYTISASGDKDRTKNAKLRLRGAECRVFCIHLQ